MEVNILLILGMTRKYIILILPHYNILQYFTLWTSIQKQTLKWQWNYTYSQHYSKKSHKLWFISLFIHVYHGLMC